MQYLNDTAFVIKRVNFGEADRYITLFTKSHGKQDVMAKGVRKLTSKRSPHLELLNHIKFSAVKTRKNFILTEVEVIKTYKEIKVDQTNLGFIFLVCELLDKLCAYNQNHEDIFSLVENTLGTLSQTSVSASVMHFETQILTHLGFWDKKRVFSNHEDIENFIENLTEKKIKTKRYLKI